MPKEYLIGQLQFDVMDEVNGKRVPHFHWAAACVGFLTGCYLVPSLQCSACLADCTCRVAHMGVKAVPALE